LNKKKIINDPVYGFITIPNERIFDIIEHRYVQRLRRIRQLGISDLIYPGAIHSRFHHAIGAMHLMGRALNTLRSKGHEISDQEYEAAEIAILLHDIGHGPFSHSLEFCLFPNVAHEQISLWLIERMNKEFNGELNMALEIFKGTYHRKFLNQLVASQLDIDRLDYLRRDSFFTGVQEGTIGAERIIKILNLVNDELVVEEKGIYSVENFLSARRLMYWQVYLHKAAVAAEVMLVETVLRARKLIAEGNPLITTPALGYFLSKNQSNTNFQKTDEMLEQFSQLDDTDVWGSIKFWVKSDDLVIRTISNQLLNRRLFGITMSNEPPSKADVNMYLTKVQSLYDISAADARSFVKTGTVSNSAYISENQSINILTKSGELIDVAEASDLPNIHAMSKIVKKHYLCYPKELSL
jgi:HD superfamily phosphohydrolase